MVGADAKDATKLSALWDKRDLLFDLGESERFRKDVPNAEVHVLDAGHSRAGCEGR